MLEILLFAYAAVGALIAVTVLATLPRGRLADTTETALAALLTLFGPALLAFFCGALVVLLGMGALTGSINSLLKGGDNGSTEA